MRGVWMLVGLAGCGALWGTDGEVVPDTYEVVSLDAHGCGRLAIDQIRVAPSDTVRPGAQKSDRGGMTYDFTLVLDAWGADVVLRLDCDYVDGDAGAFSCGPTEDGWLRAWAEGAVDADGLDLAYTSEVFSDGNPDATRDGCAFEAVAEPLLDAGSPFLP
ncbi:MAG: hypothetical protein R3F59_32030 [Myxococcota bacterium]